MPIEMPRGLPFSVDTWTPSSKKKRHHFLTHAHKDHSQGITMHSSYPIYSSRLTKALVLQYYPQLDESLFVGIEVGQRLIIDDPDGAFSVAAFDANHCPGAVMFLFEGNFGNILHTGDCRLTPDCLQSIPEKYIGRKDKEPKSRLDYVFLDCTFGRCSLKMPSKYSAIQQVIKCIWHHPDAQVVYLTCDLLGHEEILVEVSRTFGSKIFIDGVTSPECFCALTLTAPEIITQDPLSRLQMFDAFPRLHERAKAKLAEAKANFQLEPLIIRPSAQWYVCDDELSESERQRKKRSKGALRDQFGIWHVCYSMHSSREELEWALQLLAPLWVVSTTPSCRAMELDYVKKHCLGMQLASIDPLWKLLDINVEVTSNSDASNKVLSSSSVLEDSSQLYAEFQTQPARTPTLQKLWLNLSPPSKRPPVTLFGRARLGLENSAPVHEARVTPIEGEPWHNLFTQLEQKTSLSENDAIEMKNKKESLETLLGVGELQDGKPMVEERDVSERWIAKSAENEKKTSKAASCSPIGSSKCFSESFRKLYRSMNVPVPLPLPSLVELMIANKHTKRSFQF